ncbi:MAG: MBL fold metallo-hydrolase [Chloroflexi bacterium]|nr:MBL fold metallo-hydrolase [Chloroflexota bacterium]
MKITRYGNLVQLTRVWAFNSFIVIEDDSLTLVDTNFSGSAKGILKAAAQLDKPIKRIVLTHADPDHIGSLDKLYEALPDVEVIASEREAIRMSGDNRLLPGEPEGKINKAKMPETKPTLTANDGDHIGSLQVIATPGHSVGHIAFLDTRDYTLIAGDAMGTVFRTIVAGELVRPFPFSAMVTWHKPTALASVKKMRALNPARLAVGHGPVLENPLEEMDRAIQRAERLFGTGNESLANAG